MALFVLALGVRLLFLWETCNTPLSLHLSGDEEGYYLWAKAIAAGEWSRNRPFYQAPLYPYFLAVFHLLPGMGPGLIRIIQAVLSSGACVLCAAAGRTWFGPRAGLFAGVLLALYPPAIYFTGLLQKTTLALFLASLFLFGASSSGWKRWKWFASGLILGGLCLTRENAAVWLPVSVAFLILRPCPNRARRLQCAVMLAIGFFMALAPALAHNWAAADRPMWITSQFGPNLYIGNRPDAGGLFVPLLPGRDHWRYEEMDARALA
ncbi:MAG: glycosyltransferase family 39 protein, partial [Pseudomonadota bacterium]